MARGASGGEGIASTEALTHEGLGVAHLDGKAVFIHGALPHEKVRFRYHNKHSRYDVGTVLEVIEPAVSRVAPRCPHFGICGGCTLQHMDPQAQILAKERILLETLAHVGKVVPERILPPILGPAWGYRRRARLGARFVPKKGGVIVGFREKNSAYITPLGSCDVLDPRIGNLLPQLRELIAGLSCPDKVPQVEVAAADESLVLIFRHLVPFLDGDRAQLSAFAQHHSLVIYLQGGNVDSVTPLEERAELTYRVPGGIRMRFEPTDFVQVNDEVNYGLIEAAIRLLDISAGDRVVDFFCGIGNFSLPLAQAGAQVIGVEGSAALVRRAEENAQLQGVAGASFRCDDLYALGEHTVPWWNEAADKVLLDPPRSGAMDLIKTFDAENIRRILYISCYPPTLARDCEFLCQVKSYRAVAAGVADMFPHTTHVESYVLLER